MVDGKCRDWELYMKYCICSILLLIDFKPETASSMMKDSKQLRVFGSSLEVLLTGQAQKSKQYDLDIILDNYQHMDFISELNTITRRMSHTEVPFKVMRSSYSTNILDYQGIDHLSKIVFTSMNWLFKHLSKRLRYYTYVKFDEKHFTDTYMLDHVFSVDCLISKSIKPVTKWANSLLSNKRAIINVAFLYSQFLEPNDEFGFKTHKIVKRLVVMKYPFKNRKVCRKLAIKPDYTCYDFVHQLEPTLSTLIQYNLLLTKLFGPNGLNNPDYQLVSKLPRRHELYSHPNIGSITFDTQFVYRFIFVKELLTFPPTKNLECVIESLDLGEFPETSKDILFYFKWFTLIQRVVEDANISKILAEMNLTKELFFKYDDVYDIIQFMKTFLHIVHLRKNYGCCYICGDMNTWNSPLHLCSHGHTTHLSCTLPAIKKYLIAYLKHINTAQRYPPGDRTLKLCGLCKSDYLDIINEKTVEPFESGNDNMSGIVRAGDKLPDHLSSPADYKLLPGFSHNLHLGLSSKKYAEERFQVCSGLFGKSFVKTYKKIKRN